MNRKRFDICVFGATGFTGKLVAEYLSTHEDIARLSWAIAGRNKQKLEQVAASLTGKKPELLIADVANHESLHEMARQSRVIITTVGPYTRYGEPLIRACIDEVCDYVDLVGEPNFVDVMRYKYHQQAKEAGVKIINACGFDSIPHDLGVLYAVMALREKLEGEQQKYMQVECQGFVSTNAKISGGTWHSAITAMTKSFSHARRKKQWRDEGYRGQEEMRAGRKVKLLFRPFKYSRFFSRLALPLPTIDPQIVIRSAQLRSDYGLRFTYGHYVLLEKWWHAPVLIAGIALVFIMVQTRLGRERLERFIQPGQGPDEQQRKNSWFKVDIFARAGKQEVHARVSGGDPGYDETSKMLAESALCLALQRDQCAPALGITSPAAGMGEPLLQRLQKAGLGFEIITR